MKTYQITPIGKPRMTQRDKWLNPPRKCVAEYWRYKDNLRMMGLTLPLDGYWLIFRLPMPNRWSKRKKQTMEGKRHESRPDKDNLEKSVLDALYEEDSHVWCGGCEKVWGYEGSIEVMTLSEFIYTMA